MPRYYFDIYDGHSDVDMEGSELDSIVHARQEAIRLAADTLYEEGAKGAVPSDWHMDVLNEQREVLFVLEFNMKER